jgi:hypothetical protein
MKRKKTQYLEMTRKHFPSSLCCSWSRRYKTFYGIKSEA